MTLLPYLPKPTIVLSLFENSTDLELTVSATDQDSSAEFSDLVYSIVPSDFRQNFSVDLQGNVNVLKLYDFESGPRNIQFIIIAEDGGGLSAAASVRIEIIDQNEHAPVFRLENYTVSIPENTEVSSIVVQVSAEDHDFGEKYGVVSNYSIHYDGEPSELPFEINPESGDITLIRSLDYETGPRLYTFVVTATDSGGSQALSAETKVTITITNVNESPACPMKTTFSVNITENGVPELSLLTVEAFDSDDPTQTEFVYTIIGDFSSDFRITSHGELFLLQAQDYESITNFKLHIQVSDGIQACPYFSNVTVTIVDVNDNAPVIFPPSLELTIEENHLELHIANFNATDADLSAPFSTISRFTLEPLEAETALLPFIITSDGQLRATRSLDAEGDPKVFVFYIFAFDTMGLKSPTVNVTIHVENINDNQPLFDQPRYYSAIHEDTPANSFVLSVSATDEDVGIFGEITFSLVESGYPFVINPLNGSIFTARTFDLDNEPTRNLALTVVATDGGGYMDTTILTLRIGDDDELAPMIELLNYSMCIEEGTDLDTVVLTVFAQDKDSPPEDISFSILSREDIPFGILSNGSVVTRNFLTDFETGPSTYTFSIIATDVEGRPSDPADVEDLYFKYQ